MRRRGWLIVAVAAGLVLAAMSSCDPTDLPLTHDGTPEGALQAARGDDQATAREHVRRRVEAPTAVPTPNAQEVAGPPSIDGFPAIDVRVVRADGSPAVGATVYALRAGAPGRTTDSAGPHGGTNADGRGRLVLPGTGSFDVGAIAGRFQALLTDVAVPREEPVVITLPAVAEVVVAGSASAVARLRPGMPQLVNVGAASYGTATCRYVPGRAETLQWTIAIVFPEGQDEVRLLVPVDTDLALSTGGGFSGTPERFRAPQEVRVDHRDAYYVLALNVLLEPPPGDEPREGWLKLTIACDPAGSIRPTSIAQKYERLRVDADGRRVLALRVAVSTSAGRLLWSGPGIESGVEGLAGLRGGIDNELTIAVRLDGTPLPRGNINVNAPPPTRLRVLDPTGSELPVKFFVAHTYGGGMGTTVKPGDVATTRVYDPGWIVAYRELDVAGPVRITEASDDVHELTLQPGGLVTIDVPYPPPSGLGPLTVERQDGALLLANGSLLARVGAHDGMQLGPLPASSHEFVLRIGGERFGELSAHVRPGATATLSIPRLKPVR